MHRARPSQVADHVLGKPAAPARFYGETRHPGGMTHEVRRHQIGEVAGSGECSVHGVACQHVMRTRFGGHHGVPRRPFVRAGEHGGRFTGEDRDDRRVERVASTLGEDMHGMLLPAEPSLEGRIAGDVHDAQGQGQLSAAELVRFAPTVPALGDRGEQGRDVPVRPHAGTEPRPHLADGAQMLLVGCGGLRQASSHPSGLDGQCPGPGKGVRESRQGLRPRAEQHRVQVATDGTLVEEFRDHLGIGSAPDVEEQTPVVRAPRGRLVHTESVAQAHGDHRAVESVLERKAPREIRHQGEGPQNLGRSYLVTVGRRSAGHDEKVLPDRDAQPSTGSGSRNASDPRHSRVRM